MPSAFLYQTEYLNQNKSTEKIHTYAKAYKHHGKKSTKSNKTEHFYETKNYDCYAKSKTIFVEANLLQLKLLLRNSIFCSHVICTPDLKKIY